MIDEKRRSRFVWGEYVKLVERHAAEIHPGTGTDQSVHGGNGGGGDEKPEFTEMERQWVEKGMRREDRTFKLWEDTYMGDMTKEDRARLTEGRPYTYVSYFRPLGVWFKPDSGGDIGFYDRLLFTSEPMDARELSRHELVAFSNNAVVDSVLEFYESEYPENHGVYSFHRLNEAGDGYKGRIVHKTVRAERDKYPWRVSTWDMKGFFGHSLHSTLEEAIEDGIRGGTEMRPSTVEYIMGSDEFHEAVQATRDVHKEFNKRAEEKPQDGDSDLEIYNEIMGLLAALPKKEPKAIKRHYSDKHPGTGTDQDVHAGGSGGDGKTRKVGITTHKGDEPDETKTYNDMRAFEAELSKIEGVSNVLVGPSRGAWQGGGEPSWRVEFEGNGLATALIARTGRDSNQDSVLLMEPCVNRTGCEPIFDWSFGEPLGDEARDAIEQIAVDEGFSYWMWYNKKDGNTALRIASVPDYGAPVSVAAAESLRSEFTEGGFESEVGTTFAQMIAMTKEGKYAYDSFIGSEPEETEGGTSQGESQP